jgi:hypothetical protein
MRGIRALPYPETLPMNLEARIRAMREAARRNGDLALRLLCDIALDEHDHDQTADDYSLDRHETAVVRHVLGMSQPEAWRDCAAIVDVELPEGGK